MFSEDIGPDEIVYVVVVCRESECDGTPFPAPCEILPALTLFNNRRRGILMSADSEQSKYDAKSKKSN